MKITHSAWSNYPILQDLFEFAAMGPKEPICSWMKLKISSAKIIYADRLAVRTMIFHTYSTFKTVEQTGTPTPQIQNHIQKNVD